MAISRRLCQISSHLPVTRTAFTKTAARSRAQRNSGKSSVQTSLEGHKICVGVRRHRTSSVQQHRNQYRGATKMLSPHCENKPSVHHAGTPRVYVVRLRLAHGQRSTTQGDALREVAAFSPYSTFVSFTSCPDTRVCLALHKIHFAPCFVKRFDSFLCRDHQTVSRFAKYCQ